jgi:signal transduction histidine kinase
MTRVLSHEINNSLSPIKSLAQSLVDVFTQCSDDKSAVEALEVIASRSNNLMQFVNRYASLNQQFEIKLEHVHLAKLIEKVTALFEHDIISDTQNVQVQADPILLEQVLINLIKNAVEASPKNKPVKVSVKQDSRVTHILVEDSGSGIANPDNLFVPFYTTKDNGKGIGLALSRNMIEQQGGRLTLQNKENEKGAKAEVILQ